MLLLQLGEPLKKPKEFDDIIRFNEIFEMFGAKVTSRIYGITPRQVYTWRESTIDYGTQNDKMTVISLKLLE